MNQPIKISILSLALICLSLPVSAQEIKTRQMSVNKAQSSSSSSLRTKRVQNPNFPVASDQKTEIQSVDAQAKQEIWDLYKSMKDNTPRKAVSQTLIDSDVDPVQRPKVPEKPSLQQKKETPSGLAGILQRYQSNKADRADMKSRTVE